MFLNCYINKFNYLKITINNKQKFYFLKILRTMFELKMLLNINYKK